MTREPSADLTLLTDPVPHGSYAIREFAKRAARRVRNRFRPLPAYLRSPYRGHFAVTRSLVEGLRQTKARFNYNPGFMAKVAPTVVVLSGLQTLRQAVAMKREGRIRRLIAGPNILVFPSDARDLICAPEVDVCITPDRLTGEMYMADCPELVGRCTPWPAGVDTSYWRPAAQGPEHDLVLVYEKRSKGPIGPIDEYVRALHRLGYRSEVIRYGGYLPADYLNALQRASLLIGFSPTESQGIAWAEAWSTGVPMLSWYQDAYTYRGKKFNTSPAPYLSKDTGLFFESIDEFEAKLAEWNTDRMAFKPREWVLENMSDEVCARKLCDIAGVAA